MHNLGRKNTVTNVAQAIDPSDYLLERLGLDGRSWLRQVRSHVNVSDSVEVTWERGTVIPTQSRPSAAGSNDEASHFKHYVGSRNFDLLFPNNRIVIGGGKQDCS